MRGAAEMSTTTLASSTPAGSRVAGLQRFALTLICAFSAAASAGAVDITHSLGVESHQGGKAALTFPAGAGDIARLEIASLGDGKPWQIKLVAKKLRLVAADNCTIKFQARADRQRAATVSVRQDYDPWKELGLVQRLDIGPEWRDFAFDFAARRADDRVCLTFDVGDSDPALEIRALQLGGALIATAVRDSPPLGSSAAPAVSAEGPHSLGPGSLRAHDGCVAELSFPPNEAGTTLLRIQRTDGVPSHVRYEIGPSTLASGVPQRFVLRAKAQQTRQAAIEIVRHENQHVQSITGQSVRLTSDWQEFSLELPANSPTGAFGVFVDVGHDLPDVSVGDPRWESSPQRSPSMLAHAQPVGVPAEWALRLSPSCQAILLRDEDSGAQRVAIARFDPQGSAGIQLVKTVRGIRAGDEYQLQLRLRADAPRTMVCTLVQVDHLSLGLQEHLQATTDWQQVQRGFVATHDALLPELVFQLGDSNIDVELADVRLSAVSSPDDNLLAPSK